MPRGLLQAACLRAGSAASAASAAPRSPNAKRDAVAAAAATRGNSSTLQGSLCLRTAQKRRGPRRATTRAVAAVAAAAPAARRRPYRDGEAEASRPDARTSADEDLPPSADERAGATWATMRDHARAQARPCALRRRRTRRACSGDALLSRARRQRLASSRKALNSRCVGASARAAGAPREIGALCALTSSRSERSGAAVASKGFDARGRDGWGGTRGLAARWRGSCEACLSMAESSWLRLASRAFGPVTRSIELRVNKIRRMR